MRLAVHLTQRGRRPFVINDDDLHYSRRYAVVCDIYLLSVVERARFKCKTVKAECAQDVPENLYNDTR